MTKLAILVFIAAALAVAFVVWRRRVRARRVLDALARQFAFERLPAETDEELRERMRARLWNRSPAATLSDVQALIVDTLWKHGYPRVEVEFTEPAPGHVRAHARAKVPADVLRSVETDLRDALPVYVYLELTADA